MSETAAPTPDAARVEAFEARFTQALNDAGMMVMISTGHRMRLFDT